MILLLFFILTYQSRIGERRSRSFPAPRFPARNSFELAVHSPFELEKRLERLLVAPKRIVERAVVTSQHFVHLGVARQD